MTPPGKPESVVTSMRDVYIVRHSKGSGGEVSNQAYRHSGQRANTSLERLSNRMVYDLGSAENELKEEGS